MNLTFGTIVQRWADTCVRSLSAFVLKFNNSLNLNYFPYLINYYSKFLFGLVYFQLKFFIETKFHFSAEDEVKFNSSIVKKLQIDLDRNDRFLSEGNDQIQSIIDILSIRSMLNSISIKFDLSKVTGGHKQTIARLKSYLIG